MCMCVCVCVCVCACVCVRACVYNNNKIQSNILQSYQTSMVKFFCKNI